MIVAIVIANAILLVWRPLFGVSAAVALALFTLAFRSPASGLAVSLLTLIVGQTVRLPLFGAETNVLPNDLLLPIIILAWLARRVVDRQPIFVARPLGQPLLLFGSALLLSLVAAWNRGTFTDRQLAVAALYVLRWGEYLMLFFIARSVVSAATLRRWLRLVGGIALALALLGFLQLYFFPDFSSFVPQGWDPHIGRLLSTWYDPNFLAGFFAVTALLFLAMLHEKTADRWFSLAVAGVSLLALVLTFSRSGYAGLVVGFGLLTLARSRHFLALGLLVAVGVFLFVPRVQERVIGIRSIDETAQLRLLSWRNALTVMADYPWLGVGYNTYRYIQVDYGFLKDSAEHSAGGSDSSFLTVGVTTGAVGLVAFLALLASIFRATWLAARRATEPMTRSLGYGLLAGLVALVVHGQFVNGLLYPHLMEMQWVLLGFLLGVDRQSHPA